MESYSEIIDKLLELEKEQDFFKKKFSGIYIWKYIRRPIEVCIQNAAPGLAQNMIKTQMSKRVNMFLLNLKRNVFDYGNHGHWGINYKKNDVLFFTQQSIINEDGYAVNRYVEDYIENTGLKTPPCVVEWTLAEKSERMGNPKSKNLYYISHEYIVSNYMK